LDIKDILDFSDYKFFYKFKVYSVLQKNVNTEQSFVATFK